MKVLEKIDYWDMPNTDTEPNGYDQRTVPALTRQNLEYVIEKHNELVDVVLSLLPKEDEK